MRRLTLGIFIGILIGGTGVAAGRTLVVSVPRGAVAVVHDPGGQNGTQISFPKLGLDCLYIRAAGPPPEQNLASDPQLLCGRSPVPSGLRTSRTVIVTPYRVFVRNAAGHITYHATRTP